MREFATDFYHSRAWTQTRDNYAAEHHHLCERCLNKGIYRPGVIVHHKTFLTPDNINDPGISLNPDNLMLVCRDCHAALHKPEKRYKVDELGRIIIIE